MLRIKIPVKKNTAFTLTKRKSVAVIDELASALGFFKCQIILKSSSLSI